MSLIVGGPLSKRGYETLAIDTPGYGLTKVNPEDKFTYDTWVQRARDPRPIVLYGLSAGGKHREG
jgi:alpha-beta hydrolase superfamily lysophospholipase